MQDRGRVDLRAELSRLYGYQSFQGRQEDVVAQVMAGVDTIAVMPTGAGKSLCYQLPAMLLPGTTLIISPLIALMKDQYDSLPAPIYERTTFINSTLDAEQLSLRVREILAGKYKLVYCAPERLRQQSFVEAVRKARISLLVVDEAHCVAMWGHDFRPDYLFIGKCLPLLEHPTLLALTATATPQMRHEIAAQLGRELKPVVASVFRQNLYYEVDELGNKEEKLRRLIEICRSEKGAGVVYTRSRKDAEEMAAMLRREGIGATHYHAGMDMEERTRSQEMFMFDRVRVIVATMAFGMGIDKANVRFIVHFSPTDTLEGYVQESGRAGRDGRPARCVLFLTSADKGNLTRWKRQEQLKLDELRTVYRELARQLPAGKADFVNLGAIEAQISAASGKEFSGTQVRVSISLLERVGLIVRHSDAPRTAIVTLTPKGQKSDDPEFLRFMQFAYLQVGQSARRDVPAVSEALEMSPSAVEKLLLAWADRGWVEYVGERREAVIERLRPPSDVAQVINQALEQQDQAHQHQINQIITYASADRCRHQMLAAHLGETIAPCGESCDFCAPRGGRIAAAKADLPPIPDNAGQVIVECLASFPFSVGKRSLVKALTGSAASNVRADRVRHFGALAAASGTAIGQAIDELVEQGYLEFYEEDGFKLLSVTREGLEGVPSDAVSMKAKKAAKEKKSGSTAGSRDWSPASIRSSREPAVQKVTADEDRPPTPEEADLFERLRAWRLVTARRLQLPPYIICHDKTLWALARSQPRDEDEMLKVKGIGRNLVDKYGVELLELISQE